ncbi:MAG: hypothetical protein WC755_05820 [Candidatus Woesearchaeota archaeon]|jgi:hypothetical protein
MHSYSLSEERNLTVYFYLAVVSIFLFFIIYRLLNIISIQIPWYIESPSALTIFFLMFFLFDRYIWKLPVLSFLSKTPVLEGDWKGYITSTHNNHKSRYSVKLSITQTWSKIQINMRCNSSKSKSNSAVIIQNDSDIELIYTYKNIPKANSVITMNRHIGTVELSLNKNTLEGEYYTNRDRTNQGYIKLNKIIT